MPKCRQCWGFTNFVFRKKPRGEPAGPLDLRTGESTDTLWDAYAGGPPSPEPLSGNPPAQAGEHPIPRRLTRRTRHQKRWWAIQGLGLSFPPQAPLPMPLLLSPRPLLNKFRSNLPFEGRLEGKLNYLISLKSYVISNTRIA